MTSYTYFADITSWFFIAFLIGTILESSFSTFMDWLNSSKNGLKRKISKLHGLTPEAKKFFPPKKIYKALEYKNVKDSFGDMCDNISSGFEIGTLLFGITPFMIALTMCLFPGLSPVWCFLIASSTITLGTSLFNLPFSHYHIFNIEKRFGFNRMSKKTFYVDFLKAFVVSVAISVPFILVVNWFVQRFGTISTTNIMIFVCSLMLFGKIIEWVWLNFIMPLFNKFEPLDTSKLRFKELDDSIKSLCSRCGLKIKNIEVMDESKRSNHSNAFVCGAFGKKRIILFDTLLKQHTNEEILGIVAHEIGHIKLHHLLFTDVYSFFRMAILTFVTFALMKQPDFYHAFGYSWVTPENIQSNMIMGFVLVSTFIGAFTWVLDPISTYFIRRHEYAADRYAIQHLSTSKEIDAYRTALLKLTSSNLSDLFPHPLYESLFYSHPSIMNRVRAIDAAKRHRYRGLKAEQ